MSRLGSSWGLAHTIPISGETPGGKNWPDQEEGADNGQKLNKCTESVLLSRLESLPPRLVPLPGEAALQGLGTHLLSPRLLRPAKEKLTGCSSSLMTSNA